MPSKMHSGAFLPFLLLFTLALSHAEGQTSNADLTLSFSNSPPMVSLGQYFTVTVAVFNNGLDPAANVVVSNWLPANATFVGAVASQGSVTQAAGVVAWTLGSLAYNRGAALTIELQASQLGSLTNFAQVSAATPDSVSTNNQATFVTGVTAARFYGVGRTHVGYNTPTLTLMTNNQVLVVGQHLGYTADLYNVSTRSFVLPLGSTVGAHENGSATLLKDGTVLVAGGLNATGAKTAEIYNPVTQLFHQVGDMLKYSAGHTATLQPDGTVLFCGGSLTTNELYTPASQSFSFAPSLSCPFDGILLPTGKYLYFGYGRAYLYDPATGNSVETSGFLQPRAYHTATLLPNGKVLIAGGQGTWGATYNTLASAELYDPLTDTFTWTANLNSTRRFHSARLLPDGTVLLAGGDSPQSYPNSLTTAGIYDPNGAPGVPGVLVHDASVLEGNAGTNYLSFAISLTSTSAFPVTVQYASVDGTGKTYQWGGGIPDYLAVTGAVTFPPGTTNLTVQVPVLGDTVLEPDETLFLNLSAPEQAWLARASATGTILNDDTPPELTLSPVALVEGDSGLSNAVFAVQLSSPCLSTVTVDYFTSDETGQAGTDYLATSGTLTISPGTTNLTLAVPVIGDLIAEPDETFRLNLTNAQNAVIATGSAVGTILNDDGLAGKLHHFDWAAIPSPQTQTIDFPVTLTARDAFGGLVTNVPWPVQFSARTTNVLATNLDFEQPNLAGWVPFNNTSDPGRKFQQALYDVAGLGQPSTAFRTIAGGGTNGIAQGVWLAGGLTYTFSVNVVQSMEGYDMSCLGAAIYLQVGSTNVSWGVGGGFCTGAIVRHTLSLAFTAPTNGLYPLQLFVSRDYLFGDAVAVYADDVHIGFPLLTPTVATNFTNGVWSGSLAALQSASNVVLVADDHAGHIGSSNPFNITSAIDLGLSGTAQVLGAPPLRTGMLLGFNLLATNHGPALTTSALVQYALPTNVSFVTATNSQGAVTNPAGVVQWTIGTLPAGATATASLVVRADVPGLVTNVFTLNNEFLELNPADNTLQLTNAILPPLLAIAPASGTEAVAASTGLVFNVSLSGPSGQPIAVDYFTSDGSATNGVDYLGTNGTVLFPSGVTNAAIQVFPIDNILDQPNRIFTVTLTNPVNADLSVTNATGTIQDDDPPPVVWIADTSLLEGDAGTKNAIFPLTLSKPAVYDVVVTYLTQDGTATATNDYVATPRNGSTVTIPAGTTNAAILVPVNGNTVNEPDETFLVRLTAAANATLGTNLATGTILNDDAVPGRLDHFVFSPVPSPQYTNRPFLLTVKAVDYLGNPASFSGSALLTAQSDAFFTPWLADDFEDGDLPGWTNNYPALLSVSNVNDTAATGARSVRLTGRASLPASVYGLRQAISNCFPTDLSFRVRAAQTTANCGRFDAVANGSTVVDFYLNSKGLMGLAAGNKQPSFPYESNRWYRVDLKLNWNTRRVDCRIDGALVVTNVEFPSYPYSGLNTLVLQNTDPATSWFDDIHWDEFDHTNLLVFPSNLTSFVNGAWSNTVSVALPATNSYFTIADASEHVGQSGFFDVLRPGLRLDIPTALTEGDQSVTGRVSIPFALTQPLTVTFTSSVPAQVTVTPSVVIPAGQTNAALVLNVLDDALLNGPRWIALTARATNYVDGAVTLLVQDNESAALNLTLPGTAAETAGTLVNAGHLFASAPPTETLMVNLVSSDPASVTVPSSVALYAGTTSAVFNVTLVDNQKIDGPREVNITASLSNWSPATNAIEVTDNEDTYLRLAGPGQLSEGSGPVLYSVNLSGTLASNLTVTLKSSDASRLAVPASATIPAGQTSGYFLAGVVDDTNYNGSETIAVSAAASGFTSASTNVLLLDNEVHHFAFASIPSPQTSSVPFSVTVSARDAFGGPITAYNGPVSLTTLGSGGPILFQPTNVVLSAGQWTGNVTLFTAEPLVHLQADDGGGVSGSSAAFAVVPPNVYLLNLAAADLVYSPISQRLWALVSSNGTLVPIDPILDQAEPGVPIGNAGFVQLATSGDGLYVHAANNGTNGWAQAQPGAGIYRFNTLTRSLDLMWTNQGYSVLDVEAMPGNSATVAVSWYEPGYSPYERGVYVYDNGVARTNGGGGDSIEWGESPTRLYGNLLSLSPSSFYVMDVDASGLTTKKSYSPSIIGAQFAAAGGFVFAGGGVADPERGIPVGGTGGGSVAGSSAAGRFWQFQANPGRLTAFDLATLLPIGSTLMPGVSNTSGKLIPWGTNGLAFRANNATQVAIARTRFVPAGAPADLALGVATVGLPALVTNNFSCILTVSNAGLNTATNVVLAQTLPSNARLDAVTTSSGTWTQSTGGLVCWLGQLSGGASAVVNLSFVGTNAGLALLRASVTSDSPDPTRTNNVASLPVSVGRMPGRDTVTEIRQVTSDIAWNAAAHQLFASIPNAQRDLGNSLVSFDPLAGVYYAPIPTDTEPDKLTVAANGQYVYAGLDADSSIQRIDVNSRVADLKFPTGFGNVNDIAVLPDDPHAVVATVHTTLVVYDDGVPRANLVGPTEYNQPYFLALPSSTTCYSTYPTGFRRIGIDANGATLLSDTRDTVVTYSDWEIKYGAGRLFTPGGRVFDPAAGTNIATVPYSGLVIPDESDARVFYLGGGGSTWTLSALNITNLSLAGSLTITNVSGSPTRLIRWGTDGLAFRTTGGQIFLIRTTLADDRDQDGLADTWELGYFGSINAPGSGANDDPDQDGFTNLQEEHAGTNPLVRDVVTLLNGQRTPDGGMQFDFNGPPGFTCRIECSTNLTDWIPITNFTSSSGLIPIQDSIDPNAGQKFYRAVVY
ncbi:MAG TPA: Calx-beta domain-containing protein [Verrucomicrobiae bacterium]|nr:Calx-beta domain-containing protein [Verrucomicrobiae bacterium]